MFPNMGLKPRIFVWLITPTLKSGVTNKNVSFIFRNFLLTYKSTCRVANRLINKRVDCQVLDLTDNCVNNPAF